MHRSIMIIVLAAMLLVNSYAPAMEITLGGEDIYLDSTGFELEFVTRAFETGVFMEVSFPGCSYSGKPGQAKIPVFTELLSLPASGNYRPENLVYDTEIRELEQQLLPWGWEEDRLYDNMFYTQDQWFPEEIVSMAAPVIMGGIRFSQVMIAALQYNPARKEIRIFRNLEIGLVHDIHDNRNPLTGSRSNISPVLQHLAEKNVQGFTASRENYTAPLYLVIAPNNCENSLQPLLRWKEKLGYQTYLAKLSETGYTAQAIKNFIENAYYNWETPPTYVILVGDVSGNIQCPTFYVQGYYTAWDCSDHTYTVLDGDDYFPDILIGRLSVRNMLELDTIVSKIIQYESEPYMTSAGWFTRALMLSYIDYWWQLYSARETVLEVREKLLDYTYTEVDTFISPYQSNQGELISLMNSGNTFINYRGAGGVTYWYSGSGAMFGVENMTSLNNGAKMPMVTSITCGGGDFANDWENYCLGEAFLSAGSPGQPKGAIGFIGPSEHDTKTPFNNANDMGIYQGVTQEDLFRCGEMLLRGKMELYNCYPDCHGWGNSLNSDQFYFYVYNLLGDPGLQIWTYIPGNVSCTLPADITTADNFIEVNIVMPVADRENFVVALTDAYTLLASGKTDAAGNLILPVELEPGEYQVTLSRYGFIPQTYDLTVGESDMLALAEAAFAAELTAGENVTLTLALSNLSEQNSGPGNLVLTSADENIQFINGNAAFDNIAPGYTVELDFELEVLELWQDQFYTEIFASTSSDLGEQQFLINGEIDSPEVIIATLEVDNESNSFLRGTNNLVDIYLYNTGSIPTGEFELIISASDEFVVVNQPSSSFDNIAVGESGENDIPFQIEITDEAITGQIALLEFTVLKAENVVQNFDLAIPVGILEESSPTFCSYGYMAVESQDEGNFTVPVFDWVELDPDYGGNGTLLQVTNTNVDGFSGTVDIPFTFVYFGQEYQQMSICSNGYVTMGDCDLIFFRNRNIPSGAGPGAMIAPFWDDLTLGEVYHQYNESDHTFTVLWSRFRNAFNNYSFETFEVIFYDPQHYLTLTGDGDIKFQYLTVNNVDQNENYATVGIENESQSAGLLLTYADYYALTAHELENQTAILFTTQIIPQVGIDGNIIVQPLCNISNYPNPFNPETTIGFELRAGCPVRLDVFNLRGEKVRTLLQDFLAPGFHAVVWNGTDGRGNVLGTGIYLYQIQTGDYRITNKMLLLK